MYSYVKLLQAGYGSRLIKLIQSLCVCVCVCVSECRSFCLLAPVCFWDSHRLPHWYLDIRPLLRCLPDRAHATQRQKRQRERERYIRGEEQEQQQQSTSVERIQLRICRGQGALFDGASQLPAVFRHVGFLLLRFSVVS
jgi:hypothetical protein